MNTLQTPSQEVLDRLEASVDIETLSTATDGVIVSVGAVLFDPHSDYIHETYYQLLELDTQIKSGRRINASTLAWWMGQPEAVQDAIRKTPRQWPLLVLQELEKLIGSRPVWTNGPAFDAAFLHHLADSSGVPRAWGHRQDRCYRTLNALFPAPAPDLELTKHDALEDALYQARQIQLCYQVREETTLQPREAVLIGDGTGEALPPIG